MKGFRTALRTGFRHGVHPPEEMPFRIPSFRASSRVVLRLQNMSRLPTGTLHYKPLGIMASSDQLRIVVRGRQTHGALPWQGVDPIVAADGRSLARAMRVAKSVHSGIVWMNTYRMVSSMAEFGGFKNSGTGREDSLGEGNRAAGD